MQMPARAAPPGPARAVTVRSRCDLLRRLRVGPRRAREVGHLLERETWRPRTERPGRASPDPSGRPPRPAAPRRPARYVVAQELPVELGQGTGVGRVEHDVRSVGNAGSVMDGPGSSGGSSVLTITSHGPDEGATPSVRDVAWARRSPMVTRDAIGLRGGSGGLDAAGRPWPRALRHPGGVRPARRHTRRPGSRAGTASTRARTPTGSTWWAPRALGWWIGVLFAVGSICFALGSFPPYATAVGTNPDDLTYLHRLDLLHDRLLLGVLRDGLRALGARRGTAPRSAVALQGAAPPDRLVGGDHPVRRHAVVQPDHPERAPRGARGVAGPSPGVAARRAGLGVLPGLELAVLGRGVPRAVRLAPVAPLVVDHPAEPRGLRRLRGLGDRLLREAQWPAGQPGTHQSGHVRRRGLLPGRAVLLLPERTLASPSTEPEPSQPVGSST